jgi:hypothetical protein
MPPCGPLRPSRPDQGWTAWPGRARPRLPTRVVRVPVTAGLSSEVGSPRLPRPAFGRGSRAAEQHRGLADERRRRRPVSDAAPAPASANSHASTPGISPRRWPPSQSTWTVPAPSTRVTTPVRPGRSWVCGSSQRTSRIVRPSSSRPADRSVAYACGVDDPVGAHLVPLAGDLCGGDRLVPVGHDYRRPLPEEASPVVPDAQPDALHFGREP